MLAGIIVQFGEQINHVQRFDHLYSSGILSVFLLIFVGLATDFFRRFWGNVPVPRSSGTGVGLEEISLKQMSSSSTLNLLPMGEVSSKLTWFVIGLGISITCLLIRCVTFLGFQSRWCSFLWVSIAELSIVWWSCPTAGTALSFPLKYCSVSPLHAPCCFR